MIRISEVSKLTGVTVKILKIWDNRGNLKAKYKTAGGHRRYDIENFLGNNQVEQNIKRNVFIYCRVSTKKQQESGNLQRQKDRLIQYCNERQYNIINIFEETASGLNDKRRELIKSFNVNIEVIEEKTKLEPNEEMVNDLISVVTCFSTRMYGARGGRKIKKDIKKSIKELSIEGVENSENNNESNINK